MLAVKRWNSLEFVSPKQPQVISNNVIHIVSLVLYMQLSKTKCLP